MPIRKKHSYRVGKLGTSLAILLLAVASRVDVLLETVVTFDETNGYLPQGGLTADASGNLYGTLSYGGWHNLGTIFKIATDGKCVILTTIDGANGSHPNGRLILGKDGNFYGTTLQGGDSGSGSVFQMT